MTSNRGLIRISGTFIGALAAVSLLAAGCGKEKKDEGAKGKTETAGKAAPSGEAEAPAKGAARAVAANSGDYAVFPKDSQIIVGITGAKLRSSALFAMAKPMLLKGENQAKLEKFKACGVDVINDFQSATFGMKIQDENPLFVVKGFKREALAKCASALGDDGAKMTEDGKFSVITKDGKSTALAWTDATTFMGGPNWDKAGLEPRLAGTDGADKNAVLMDILSQADTSSAIWLAMTSEGVPTPPGMPGFKAAYVSVNVDKGLDVNAGVKMNSEDDAKKALAMANKQMTGFAKGPMGGMFGKYLAKVTLGNAGDLLTVKMMLSAAELKELSGMAMGMMGGM